MTSAESCPAGGRGADKQQQQQNKQVTAHMLMMMDENVEILSELDDQLSLESAAQQSRLPGDRLTTQEAACFPDMASAHGATQKLFLYIRNRILTLWLQNVRQQLTSEECLAKIPEPYNSDQGLITRVHAFLERYGFINFGVYRIIKPSSAKLGQQCASSAASTSGLGATSTDPSPKPTKIIVIGAGMAGLIAARQLESFGCSVTVLEARSRVGGRIMTFNKGSYTADLGAMVITGLGGNPLSVLARQIPMELQKIRSKCPLFQRNMHTVPKDRDDFVEKEFNKILEAAAFMANSMDLTEAVGSGQHSMSLGDAVEVIIKLQEKQICERQMEYWKTMVELQEKMKKNQHRLMRLREALGNEHVDYMEVLSKQTEANKHDVVDIFDVRSRKRDLHVMASDYERLMEHQREIEDALRELEDCEPHKTYLNDEDRQIFNWHLANLEFANSAPVDKLSLRHWDQDDEWELQGSHMCVAGGYSVVPIHLASRLDIKLNTAVRSVRQLENGMELSVYNSIKGESDEGDIMTADAVLCTLPLGVLKHCLDPEVAKCAPDQRKGFVTFDPPLPDWKQAAVGRLGFGNLNKVALCFDRVFWDHSVNIFGIVPQSTASRGEFFQFWSLSKDPAKSPVLLGLVAGEAAEKLESLNDDVVSGNALATLRRIFGNVTPSEISDVVVTRWRNDAWSRGSYSFVAKQATGDDYDLLAAPVALKDSRPRLFFAGEHTIRNYPATVHGAFLSGIREAGRIADQFLGIPYAPSMKM